VLEIIYAGGWVMLPIILCSILSVTITVERFWALRRSKVTPGHLAAQVEEWAARHELDKRHIDQLAEGSALGKILAAALANRHRPRERIKESVEDVGRQVIHQLERFLNTLGTIAGLSPLLGLLGTVIGMIQVFAELVKYGGGNAQELSGGISTALITTAAGLTVAIPSYFFYRYFKGRVDEYVVEMEQEAINLIEAIERGNVAQLSSRVPGG
jgi:biopolymer transport protein ExbB